MNSVETVLGSVRHFEGKVDQLIQKYRSLKLEKSQQCVESYVRIICEEQQQVEFTRSLQRPQEEHQLLCFSTGAVLSVEHVSSTEVAMPGPVPWT